MRKPICAEAVIFDLDGTLIESIPEHYEAFMETIERLGGSRCAFARYRRFLQHDTHQALCRACGVKADEETIVKMFVSIWKSQPRHITPMPGVYEMLTSLWKKGIVCGLVSGSQHNTISATLQNFGFTNFFDTAYVYGSSEKALVRKEEAFAALIRAWRIPPSHIAAVGDMPFEMRTARRHGMHAIGFLGGLGTHAMLKKAGAEPCIYKLSILTKILRGRGDV